MKEEKEELLITVKHIRRIGWEDNHYQIVGRFPKFKKWWKFWEDNYEDVPLEIVDLKTVTQ